MQKVSTDKQGEMGSENKTKVILFHLDPSVSSEEVRGYIEKVKPRVIALADFKDPKFGLMLDGIVGVDDYIRWHSKFSKPEYGKEHYELFKELHGGVNFPHRVRVEQLDPSKESAIEEEYNVTKKSKHSDLPLMTIRSRVLELVDLIRVDGASRRVGLERRGEEIAEKIRSGEWHGVVLIDEKDTTRKPMEVVLRNLLKGMQDVEIEPAVPFKYALGSFVEHLYGKSNVRPPIRELMNLYMYGKEPSQERELVLGARLLVFNSIVNIGNTDKVSEAAKMVNKLRSYHECEHVFEEIEKRKLDTDAANRFVKEYLERRT